MENLAPYALNDLAFGKSILTVCDGKEILSKQFPGKVEYGRKVFVSDHDLSLYENGNVDTYIAIASDDWKKVYSGDNLDFYSQVDKKFKYRKVVNEIQHINYDALANVWNDILHDALASGWNDTFYRFCEEKTCSELYERLAKYWKEADLKEKGFVICCEKKINIIYYYIYLTKPIIAHSILFPEFPFFNDSLLLPLPKSSGSS